MQTESRGCDYTAQGARGILGVIPACIVAVLLLSPVLVAGFYGDDYVLWHLGVQLLRDPGRLFIGPENFYRPANTWLFGLNQLLFGTNPLGYHVVTLGMHLSCGILLGFLLRRFVSSPWAVFAGTAVWMCSPYSFEPLQYVNVAYNDLTVLLVWLGLAVLWPRPGQAWTRGRLASVTVLAIASFVSSPSTVNNYRLEGGSFRLLSITNRLSSCPGSLSCASMCLSAISSVR
ncbi:MAG: hypothetical protein HYX75_21625 [Acidobacteria bacterium]|nr:hypothetical protein [Acidobacteriota bacterium]